MLLVRESILKASRGPNTSSAWKAGNRMIPKLTGLASLVSEDDG
jgi:hypothetical protein